MKKAWIYLLLVSIIHSILLYGQTLGLNVVLFTIVLLVFLTTYLKVNNLIKNKKGLLLILPIIILSSTYLVYSNIFNYLNILVIPFLYILMFIYTTESTYNIIDLLKRIINLIFKPFSNIKNLNRVVTHSINNNIKLNKEIKSKIKSIIIVIPIIIIVLSLLISADMVFENYFKGILKIFNEESIYDFIIRILGIIIFFIYTGSTLIYLLKPDKTNTKRLKIDYYTITLLITTLNIIYIVFDIIQIKSLLLHNLSQSINYAEYARSGFFQLMIISSINIIVILLTKNTKETTYNKVMSIVMVFLTLIIISSSFIRMFLYEQAFGYTILRLGVYLILITEALLLIPTVIYIINSKIKILRSYLIIPMIVYLLVNIFSIETIITENNINRYYNGKDIDIYYLENYNYDNVPILIDFYNKCSDREIKNELKIYFNDISMKNNINMDNIFEYNISKERAKLLLEKERN